jgi:hypothetical protein
MLTHPFLEQDYQSILLPVLILFRDVDPPLGGNNLLKLLMSFALKK